jgi:hypothetical protein
MNSNSNAEANNNIPLLPASIQILVGQSMSEMIQHVRIVKEIYQRGDTYGQHGTNPNMSHFSPFKTTLTKEGTLKKYILPQL